jgi:hypothetical protein
METLINEKKSQKCLRELMELVKKNHGDDYSVSSMEEFILKEEELKKLVSQKP